MTLASRLIGVFNQYRDPRVGFFTTEILATKIPHFWNEAEFRADDLTRYLQEGLTTRKAVFDPTKELPGLVLAAYDIACGIGDYRCRPKYVNYWRNQPSMLSEKDAIIVANAWVAALREGVHWTKVYTHVPIVKDGLVQHQYVGRQFVVLTRRVLVDAVADFNCNTVYDALIPWLAKIVSDILKLSRKTSFIEKTVCFWEGNEEHEYFTELSPYKRLERLECGLEDFADWVREARPNIMPLSWEEASELQYEWCAQYFETAKRKDAVPAPVVYDFADGWTVQRLTTKEHLEGESGAMEHCIGFGTFYLSKIQKGDHLSLIHI